MTLCAYCQQELPPGRPNRKFCNAQHQRLYHSARWHAVNPKSAKGSLVTGAVAHRNVLRVVLDLAEHMPYVQLYRAEFAAQDCDLIAVDWGLPFTMWRIEVVTAHRTISGSLQHAKRDASKYDVLAMVLEDGTVEYEPPRGMWPAHALWPHPHWEGEA